MLPSFTNELAKEILALGAQNNLRTCPNLTGSSRIHVLVDQQRCISFCSNDYLGLSCDPRLKTAALLAANTSGFGASASRLVSGTLPEHLALEEALASFLGAPTALLFPSGYHANLATMTALAGPSDLIVADRHVHASLLDGFRLSKAKLAIYPHLEAEKASHYLSRLGPGKRRRFLVTESLFSMDGDVAPLRDLSRIATNHDAILVVDEAHAFGTLGPNGRGLCAEAGVLPDVLMATFGKALGASGAFIAGSRELRTILINAARSFIFTTALPPPIVAAAHEALRITASKEGDVLREHLTTLSRHLQASLTTNPPDRLTPIFPIITGSNQATVEASQALLKKGIFLQAIRPPTVREGTGRLRVTLSSLHTTEHIEALVHALQPWVNPRPTARLHRPPSPAPQDPSPTINPFPNQAPQSSGIFLVGTDTGVGKTSIALALIHLLGKAGYKPVPFKPVESGATPNTSDALALLQATERTDIPLHCICPIQLPNPVAPAAHPESQTLTITALRHYAQALANYGAPLIVESAGGLLSPISQGLTPLDFAASLGLPVLLISRNALGTINHTTLAVSEILRRHLHFLGTILVTATPHATPDQPDNAKLIAQATGLEPLGTVPFLTDPTPARLAAVLGQAVDLPRLFPGFSI